jgi:DNA-binding phage protein
VVRDLFRAMAARRLSCAAVSRAAGLHQRTLQEWRLGRSPRLNTLSLVLAVVGMHIEVLPDPSGPPLDA